MTDKLALVRAYLFGTPQEREEARPYLADWMLDGGLDAEEAQLRNRTVTVWVLPGDWEAREWLMMEAPSVEYAVEKCKRIFCTEAEKEAWLAGYEEGADYAPGVYHTEAECQAVVAPMWHDARAEYQDELAIYDDEDLHSEPDPDNPDKEDLGADGSPGLF